MRTTSSRFSNQINPFVPNATFLYPLKTSENFKGELGKGALGKNGLNYAILEEIDFNIYEIRLWTDSEIALSYIRNSSQEILVNIMNRLHKLKLNSNVNEWCFNSRKNNIVDNCTRYNSLTSVTSNLPLWNKGPQFLYKNEAVFFESEASSAGT